MRIDPGIILGFFGKTLLCMVNYFSSLGFFGFLSFLFSLYNLMILLGLSAEGPMLSSDCMLLRAVVLPLVTSVAMKCE